MSLNALIAYYESLTEESVARLPAFYTEDATFTDPFNDVRGVQAIQRIFRHMFRQVETPRFVVLEKVADADGAVLVWAFHFRFRRSGPEQVIQGVSHLKFDDDGRVNFHRDYWDAASELYMKLPGISLLLRLLRRKLAA